MDKYFLCILCVFAARINITMPRILITIGLILVTLGLLWPWISKSGLGRLPGDLVIERENYKLYFPITSALLVSLLVSLVLWLLRK